MTTSVALLVASAAFVAYDMIVFRQSMASDLSTLAKVIGTNSTAALTFNDRGSAKDVLSALTAKQNIVRARIYASDSDLFAEYVRDGASGDLTLTVQQQSQVAFTAGYLVASETIDLDGETIGTVYLISNLDAFRSRLNRYAGVVAAVLFGSLLVAFLLSSKLQSLISDPISHLAKTAIAVSVDKDYTIRAVKHGNDEMGQLIDAFNEMLGQIQERDARLQTARDELERRVEERTKELQDEIAERERIEHVLRRSEEHFRSLIENASDIITIAGLDGTISYQSPSVERVLGYKPEELIGRNTNEFIHPDDDTATSRLRASADKPDNGPVSLELRFKHKCGEWRILDVFGRLVRDESGKAQVIINSRDITGRKRAAETLKESETLFRSLAETVSAAIYIYQGSKFIYVNPAAETITGYTHDELMGMEVWDILHPDFLEEAKEHAALRQKGEDVPAHSEAKILTKKGEARWIDITPSLIRFQGQPAVLATAFDVTERKGWEDALRESEEKYRTILQSIQEGYFEVDLIGTLTFFNDSLSRIVGIPAERLKGLNHREYTDPETESMVYQAYNGVFRTGEPLEGLQYQITTLEGVTRFLETSVSLRRDSTGQISGFRGTVRDVTERRRAEEALRESEDCYRDLVEHSRDLICTHDLKGRILSVNQWAARVLGYDLEAVLKMNLRDLLVPEFRSEFEQYLHAVRTQGVAEGFMKVRTITGEARVIEYTNTLRTEGVAKPIVRAMARDITERLRAEEALRESEEKYRTILESIQEGYFEVDLTGNLTFFNDSLSRIVGAPPERLMGLNSREYTNAETGRRLYAAFNQVFRTGEPLLEFQYQIVTRDGVHKFLESSILLRRDQTGEISGFRGTIRDVTERQQAEQALRESEERYKTLFESATDGIMIFEAEGDQAGRIVAANPAAAENTGYTVDELVSLTIGDLQPPEQAKLTAQDRHRIVQGEHITVELLRRRKDGTTFPIEVNAGPLTLGGKRYILSFARDLTQRKQIEKEATMLAHTVRSIQEAVCITDSEDILLFVNDAFLKTYGYERHEVVGKNIFELVRLPANSAHDTAAIPPPNLIGRWEGELLNRRKDGTAFPIHLSTSPIFDETGRTIALVGVTQDITESNRAIAELQKAKESAEAASLAKSEFLANMSHEIRTPMNGIIGMTELALDTDLTAEQREYLRLVKLSADSLLKVINDILDFSKIEAGKLELDLDEFNLQDAVDEVMKALGLRADQKGLELAYYLRPGVPDLIVGDLGRLRQILVNLVGNAIKFTERGEVIVRVDVETQTNEEVVLHFGVRDTGIGVPRDKHTMIFASFTQADGSTTRRYGGTGLGLAISSQLVHLMGGQIWVESPVDLPGGEASSGSMFHFTARFGIPRSPVTDAHPLEGSTLAGLPVLVVDDNATNRRILEVQLTNWGMSPTTAEGAGSALNAIKQAEAAGSPFKLALLDFHMPGMDGLALAEQIRMLPMGGDFRIIMMSSSLHQNQARQRSLGIDASLLKPVKAAELLGVIKAVLSTDARLQAPPRQAALKTENPLRVLVAEDSPVNQTLIMRLLEKWGHTPVIAEGGKEALALLDAGKFDLVLMDLQMPDINGFEATAAIRQKERGDGAHIPIIALTAHALKGDRERCLEAGMDDYLSKPIETQKLFDVVETAARKSERATRNGRPHIRALDIDALLKSFDGDLELVLMLARVFADSSPCQLSELYEAVALGDAEALERGAHALKGSVANFRAEAAVDAAARLEQLARTGDLSTADSALAMLDKEIERLREELETFELVSSS